MVLVTRRHLERAAAKYKDAANELKAWAVIVDKVRWRSFAEVRASFPDADAAHGYVIFNVRHNRYRLITHIHYAKDDPNKGSTRGHCYIRSFLTHAEYNNFANWDKEFGS
jgi:mRNA interferase HigB